MLIPCEVRSIFAWKSSRSCPRKPRMAEILSAGLGREITELYHSLRRFSPIDIIVGPAERYSVNQAIPDSDTARRVSLRPSKHGICIRPSPLCCTPPCPGVLEDGARCCNPMRVQSSNGHVLSRLLPMVTVIASPGHTKKRTSLSRKLQPYVTQGMHGLGDVSSRRSRPRS